MTFIVEIVVTWKQVILASAAAVLHSDEDGPSSSAAFWQLSLHL